MTYSEMKKKAKLLFDGADGAVSAICLEGETNLTEKGITLTGDESVKVLMEKIADINTAKLDNTVTFMNGDAAFTIVSVLQGERVKEPDGAMITTPGFCGWKNSNNIPIDFETDGGYLPAGDETLFANISTNYGLVTGTAGDVIGIFGGSAVTKQNTGFALCGNVIYWSEGSYAVYSDILAVCLSTTEAGAQIKGGFSCGTVNYNGETWYVYYKKGATGHQLDTSGLSRLHCGIIRDGAAAVARIAATQILEAYY